jgi:hypothetical protein
MKFLIRNFKSIIKLGFGLFILYWLIFFLTPSIKMSNESKQKIDSLNNFIKEREKIREKLDNDIINFKNEVINIDNKIDKIKTEKIIIKEYYHEKINSVDSFSHIKIDSFFTNRYKDRH